jgi:hypothetical protein
MKGSPGPGVGLFRWGVNIGYLQFAGFFAHKNSKN